MKRVILILLCLALSACASSLDAPEGSGGGGGGGTATAGSGCGGGVLQGYYAFSSNNDSYCGAGYTYVSQVLTDVYIGGLVASIDAECRLSFADGSCFGVYVGGVIGLNCGDCIYTITAIGGYGCEEGVEAGMYEVESNYDYASDACMSGYATVSQDGPYVDLGDLSGDIDAKCAVGFSNLSGDECYGVYADGAFSLDCGLCQLSAQVIPVSTSFELGVYTVGYLSSWGECSTPPLGRVMRIFVTDTYVDSAGQLVALSETTQLELKDSGNNLIATTPLNADGTAQLSYGGQTAQAWFTSFDLPWSYWKPQFKASFSPSGCEYTYSAN